MGRGAVARGTDHFERAGHFEIPYQIIKIRLAHTVDEFIRPAWLGLAPAFQNDIAQLCHFIRAMGQRAIKPHFHTRPAVGIVACRDHRHRRHIEIKLGKIRHGRERRADILDPNTGLHQPDDQGVFNGQRVIAVIIAHGNHRLNAAFLHLRAEAQAERRHAG